MPTRSGPSIRRDQDPQAFRQNLWFTIIMGAVMFVFNLCISWIVVSRRPRDVRPGELFGFPEELILDRGRNASTGASGLHHRERHRALDAHRIRTGYGWKPIFRGGSLGEVMSLLIASKMLVICAS